MVELKIVAGDGGIGVFIQARDEVAVGAERKGLSGDLTWVLLNGFVFA